MFLFDLSALLTRESIKSEVTGHVFRSVSRLFSKYAVPLLSTLDLHTNLNGEAQGVALPLKLQEKKFGALDLNTGQ